jgi:hypothetical protein
VRRRKLRLALAASRARNSGVSDANRTMRAVYPIRAARAAQA